MVCRFIVCVNRSFFSLPFVVVPVCLSVCLPVLPVLPVCCVCRVSGVERRLIGLVWIVVALLVRLMITGTWYNNVQPRNK